MNKVDSIETKNNGVRIYKPFKIEVSKDYFPNADKFNLGVPLIFIRNTSPLKTQVTYFFSEPDSLLRLIEYAWNSTSGNENKIERLFNYNDTVVSRSLNQKGVQTITKQDTWSQVKTIWDNDTVYVMQFMLIEKKPSRARVLISWK